MRYEKFGVLYGQLERLGVLYENHIYPVGLKEGDYIEIYRH